MYYSYRTFPVDSVISLTDVLMRQQLAPDTIPTGSYLSDDAETRAILETLRAGYRWIRTEDELAIFEKKVVNTLAVISQESD